MIATPIPGLPGLFATGLCVMMGVPESATRFVVGPDPDDPARPDVTELAAKYAGWVAKWELLAGARLRGER